MAHTSIPNPVILSLSEVEGRNPVMPATG